MPVPLSGMPTIRELIGLINTTPLPGTHPHRIIGLSNTFAQTISEPECFRLSRRSECANQHGCLFDAGVVTSL